VREVYTICGSSFPEAFVFSDEAEGIKPREKGPKLFLYANVAQRRHKVFPVPVGLSNSALVFCHTKVNGKINPCNSPSMTKW